MLARTPTPRGPAAGADIQAPSLARKSPNHGENIWLSISSNTRAASGIRPLGRATQSRGKRQPEKGTRRSSEQRTSRPANVCIHCPRARGRDAKRMESDALRRGPSARTPERPLSPPTSKTVGLRNSRLRPGLRPRPVSRRDGGSRRGPWPCHVGVAGPGLERRGVADVDAPPIARALGDRERRRHATADLLLGDLRGTGQQRLPARARHCAYIADPGPWAGGGTRAAPDPALPPAQSLGGRRVCPGRNMGAMPPAARTYGRSMLPRYPTS